MKRSAQLHGLIVILGLLSGSTVLPALAAPGRLVPVTSKVCQSTNFYRVQTANGAALPAYGDRNLKTPVPPIPNGTVILDRSMAFPTFQVPGRENVVFLSADRRNLAKLKFGTQFTGKMRVKTLDQGGFLNIRKQPTLLGENEKLIAGTVKDGTEVTVKGLNGDDIPAFFYIVTPDGTEGYVDRSYLVCTDSTAQATTNSPRSTVEQFYTWYLANQNNSRERLSQQKDVFEPALYQQLMQAFRKRPEDGDFLDFDPFFNNQMGGKSYMIESVNLLSNAVAQVRLRITEPRGNKPGAPFTIVLRKQNDRWQISNLKYAQGADLLSILRDINKSSAR